MSAGTKETRVHPESIQVMAKLGMDISAYTCKTLGPFIEHHFDLVVILRDEASEACPIFPNAGERWHWSIDNPSQASGSAIERMRESREVRNELERRVREELFPRPHDQEAM